MERLHGLGVVDSGPGILLVHSLFVTEKDLQLLSGTSAILGYCPFSQAQFCFPAALHRWVNAGFELMLGTDCGACNDTMNVQQELRILANGGSFSVHTSQEFNEFYSTGDTADATRVERLRVSDREDRLQFSTPQSLLDTVWRTPADLHPEYASGRLMVGGPANLAVWDLEHPSCWPAESPVRTLAMSDVSGALFGVMTNGQWRGELGNVSQSILQSSEYGEAKREANARLASLKRTLGLA